MLENFFKHLRTDFPLNEDLFEIDVKENASDYSIKIVGYKHHEILLRLTNNLEQLK
jgi:hypothetical protein